MAEDFDAEYNRARKAADLRDITEPRAASAGYVVGKRVVRLVMRSGMTVEIPVSQVEDLANAPVSKLKQVRLNTRGDTLFWDDLDVQFTVAGLMAGRWGTRQWMANIGRHGGQARTEAKAAAARTNGRLGGRPPKTGGSKRNKPGKVSPLAAGTRKTSAQNASNSTT